MNKKVSRIIAASLCGAIITGCFAVPVKAETNSVASLLDKFMEDTEVEASERVYVMADEVGNPYKVMVSRNDEKAEVVNDSENLPIKIKASYMLDGKEISASDINGATGKLKIRYDYENTLETQIKMDEKTENAHVPFAVTIGLAVSQNEYKNIKVSNGKVTKDGNNALIVAFAYPSLADDLNLKNNDLKIYDYVEIEADIENATWNNVYMFITNDVFATFGADEDTQDKDKLSQLVGGIGELNNGSEQLADGLEQLNDSTSLINDGVNSLSGGLETLSQSSGKLNTGAKQVFESLLNTANSTIAQSGASLPALTIDNYSTVLGGAINLMTASGNTAAASSLTTLKSQLDSYNTFYKGLATYTGGVDKAYEGSKKLSESMPKYASGVKTLKDGANALHDGINELNEKTVGVLSNDDENSLETLDRFKALADKASEYVSYVDENAKEGKVSFIYKMDK